VAALISGYIFDGAKIHQVRDLMRAQEARKLQQLPRNASKASAMPSADSISEARLFTRAFDTVLKGLTTKQLDIYGASPGTGIPGANPMAPTTYSGPQMDATITAGQLSVPTSSRTAAAQLQAMNWLQSVAPHLTASGTVEHKSYDRRPAASTASNSIIDRRLSALRKTRSEFFLNHGDIVLMMRCRHSELDITRFQVKEIGVKKSPAFPTR
jgi:hypothetical protein